MPETPLVRTCRFDRMAPPSPEPHISLVAQRERLAALACEARRIARRRGIVEAAAARSRLRGRHPSLGTGSSSRLATRAACLSVDLHRLLDLLHAGGRHKEALAIFRAYQADLNRRLNRAGANKPTA